MISISPPAGQFGPVQASALKEAVMGKMSTVTPPGWPCAAPSRHVHGVKDQQTTVEGIL